MTAAEQLLAAFRSGNAPLAVDAGGRLATAYNSLWHEAARLRFQVNFGGPLCERCDGLRAGPGVLATCFQVRECNYQSVKEGSGNPRQLRVLENLLERDQKDLTAPKR